MVEQSLESHTEDQNSFSWVLINLMRGVLYENTHPQLWQALLQHQGALQDYVRQMGLTLVLDEAEGYAFLQSAKDLEHLPRLVARRPLSFHVSLMLALLRKRMAEFDANSSDTRMVLEQKELVEMMQLFLPESSNEAKLVDKIEGMIRKCVDLGFLRPLKGEGAPRFEVLRILKAFVDAQWLTEFDAKLAAYAEQLQAGDLEDE